MPNWTYNSIIVKANNKQTLTRFINRYFIKDKDDQLHFDFNKVVPQPNTKEECPQEYICDCKKEHITDSKGGNWFNWFKWNYDHWGTKWNACDTIIVYQDDDQLEFNFNTAWCPPQPIFKLLRKQNPSLNIWTNYVSEGEW